MRLRVSIGVVLLWAMMVFEDSVLPDTLGLRLLARVVNAAALLGLLGYGFSVLASGLPERVIAYYCVPVLLVIAGYSINVFRAISIDALSHLGLLLPWAAALSVPFMPGHDPHRYWKHFHLFMVLVSIIAVGEYAAVFSGMLAPTVIETRHGEFLKGVFTLFHGLEDETVYYRMYGVFAEPGTFAMFLLPALAYAVLRRLWLVVPLYLTCMLLTASLGGYFGLGMLLISFAHWELRGRSAVTQFIVGIVGLATLALVASFAYEFFADAYAQKGVSAGTRESNLTLFVSHFWEIIAAAPFGMDLTGDTLSSLEGNRDYVGSNFALGTALMVGGIAGFIGYTAFFLVSSFGWLAALLRKTRNPVVGYVCISFPALATFVFQRTTIYESTLYSFLFAAPLFAALQSRRAPIATCPTTIVSN